VCRLRLKRGWLICFRQKGGLVRSIPITPELEAHYLAVELMPSEVQRRLELIKRLYKQGCWWPRRGKGSGRPVFDVAAKSRNVSGAGFSYDPERAEDGKKTGAPGARPDLRELEKKHQKRLEKAERLERGLPSDIGHAPQGGTVKIAHPAPAVRHAELKQDMADYNDKHDSYWNSSGVRAIRPCEAYEFSGLVSYADPENRRFNRKSINIPKPDPLEAFAKLEKSHSWPLEIKDGHHDNARRPIHSHHIGDGPRRRGTSG
jgi:hypothetical protein